MDGDLFPVSLESVEVPLVRSKSKSPTISVNMLEEMCSVLQVMLFLFVVTMIITQLAFVASSDVRFSELSLNLSISSVIYISTMVLTRVLFIHPHKYDAKNHVYFDIAVKFHNLTEGLVSTLLIVSLSMVWAHLIATAFALYTVILFLLICDALQFSRSSYAFTIKTKGTTDLSAIILFINILFSVVILIALYNEI